MARAPPAFDLIDLRILTGRRRRSHNPSQILDQPARRARNVRRQLASPSVDK
jgi:hypothetical protein